MRCPPGMLCVEAFGTKFLLNINGEPRTALDNTEMQRGAPALVLGRQYDVCSSPQQFRMGVVVSGRLNHKDKETSALDALLSAGLDVNKRRESMKHLSWDGGWTLDGGGREYHTQEFVAYVPFYSLGRTPTERIRSFDTCGSTAS